MLQSPAIRQPTTTDSSGHLLRSNAASIRQPTENTTVLREAIPTTTKYHHPNYFLDQVGLDLMVKRENIVTPRTGCSIAAFQYAVRNNPLPFLDDCRFTNNLDRELASKRKIHANTADRLVQEGDTLYVQFYDLQHFCDTMLPNLHVDVVVVSGAEQKVAPFSKRVFDAIVAHPRVIHWFMMNMDIYSHDPHHRKVRMQQ
jgi:hypothetical protein